MLPPAETQRAALALVLAAAGGNVGAVHRVAAMLGAADRPVAVAHIYVRIDVVLMGRLCQQREGPKAWEFRMHEQRCGCPCRSAGGGRRT